MTTHFNQWKQNLNRLSEFEGIKLYGNVALIEVYKEFIDNEKESISYISGVDAKGQPEYSTGKLSHLIHPIGKVLAIGNNLDSTYSDLKVGDIVFLPDDIKNTTWNPEYLQMVDINKGNNGITNLPRGVTKYMAKFDDKWARYRFKLDKLSELTQNDTLTYLIPLNSMFITGKEL